MKKNVVFFTLKIRIVILAFLLCFLSCTTEEKKLNLPLFEIVKAEESQIFFQNRLRESPGQNVLSYEYFYNGAGVATGDFNSDGLPDIYLLSNLESNQLYLNRGDLQFEDISQQSNTIGSRGFATGVTIVDINADGLLDIYVCKSGRFTQADLRRNELFVNQGNNKQGLPVFEEKAKEYGLDIPAYSTQAAFFDYDRDGDLDLFLINHGIDTYDIQDIDQLKGERDPLIGEMLFRNDNGVYNDVSKRAGIIQNKLGFGLGIGIGDLNNDGFPDVYVSNDYSGKDHLYINQQNGTFKEKIRELTNQTSFYAMGNDIGDINNDGWLDIVNLDMVAADNYGIKTSMSAMNPEQFQNLLDWEQHHQYMFNSLLLNNGDIGADSDPLFSNVAQMAGISNTDWSWGPLLLDMDNDGLQDIFVSNGIKRNIRNNDAMKEVRQLNQLLSQAKGEREQAQLMQRMLQQFPYHRKPNYFFLNKSNLSFEDIATRIGLDSILTASNGAAYADFDLDGDLDLIVNNVDDYAMLLQNNASDMGSYALKVRLEGAAENPMGIGTRVVIWQNDRQQSRSLYPTRGYQSAVEPVLHFGLGKDNKIDSLKVEWPDGKRQVLKNPKNGELLLKYKEAVMPGEDFKPVNTIFSVNPSVFDQASHQENEFDDFGRESLLPHKMSNIGPAAASADVNGDGLIDVFLGGSKGQSAKLFIQQASGEFLSTNESLWIEEQVFEDVAALFIDAEQDGDLDLLIGGGSNEYPLNHDAYRLRFYENTGNGNYEKNSLALPGILVSVGTIVKGDIDRDGDEDIFIGGRQVPGNYPAPANSYLLRNDSKTDAIQFTNITPANAPSLRAYGMVTDALLEDLNGDKYPDLVTVGEWMAPQIGWNDGNGAFNFESSTTGIETEVGWWQSLVAADFDQDGDLDLVGGNLGLNYKYKASKESPFEIFTNDFDENGSQDIVLSYYSEGSKFPLRGRECSSNQMPFIKDKFPTYHAFAEATVQEVYGESQLKASTHYVATNFAHAYFENNGEGKFRFHSLPRMTQISSINAILVEDINEDGYLDLLVGGNLYGSEVETPRNDASYGQLLLGDNTGNFTVVSATKTGLNIKGEVRDIAPLGGQKYIVVRNNDSPVVIETSLLIIELK